MITLRHSRLNPIHTCMYITTLTRLTFTIIKTNKYLIKYHNNPLISFLAFT